MKHDPKAAVHSMRINGFERLEPFILGLARWKCRCTVTGQVVIPWLHAVISTEHSCSACKAVLMAKPRKLGGVWIKDLG